MLKFALILAVLGCVSCGGRKSSAKCPWALGKYPFDEQKFQGDWYLISATPLLDNKLYKCGKFNFKTMKGDTEAGNMQKIKYEGLNMDNQSLGVESVSVPMMGGKPDGSSLTMGVWKKSGSEKWSPVYKQSVVATDYDSYAVFLACSPKFDDKTQAFSKKLFAGIWSRKRTLSPETVEVLKNIISGYDIDTTEMLQVDQSNC